MLKRSLVATLALTAVLGATIADAAVFDDAIYPDLKGKWVRIGPGRWDQSKPAMGLAEEAPLTPEYQAIFEANLADQASGGPGDETSWYCMPPGMPMMMTAYEPMELVVTAGTTYILISHIHDSYRRVYTDGRDWPKDVAPKYAGYSIGHWLDEDGDGRYDVLEIETRDIKGPRVFDASGVPLHRDDQTIVKERIYVDKADRNLLHDDITVIDHALTRPWTVSKRYQRETDPQPFWTEDVCAEANLHVRIGRESYYLSSDDKLMPIKKDQPPPDLRYFNQTKK